MRRLTASSNVAGMRQNAATRTRRTCRLLAVAITAVACAGFGVEPSERDTSPGAGEPWLGVLKAQLKDNSNCRLDRVLFAREVKLGADVGLEGRARCLDNREYDFSRQKPHQKFDIRLCQPTVC